MAATRDPQRIITPWALRNDSLTLASERAMETYNDVSEDSLLKSLTQPERPRPERWLKQRKKNLHVLAIVFYFFLLFFIVIFFYIVVKERWYIYERERENKAKKKTLKSSDIVQTLHSGNCRANTLDSFPSLRRRARVGVIKRPPGQRCWTAQVSIQVCQTLH